MLEYKEQSELMEENKEMAVYKFDGEKYKQASKHQKEWGNNLISQLHLCGNEAVLDLGCGDGVLSEQIAQLVPQGKVIGIDASYGMLQTAKKLECDNLSFVQLDINDMDFSDEFDIIFSNAALHWVLNHSLLLNHSFRALKQGGSSDTAPFAVNDTTLNKPPWLHPPVCHLSSTAHNAPAFSAVSLSYPALPITYSVGSMILKNRMIFTDTADCLGNH